MVINGKTLSGFCLSTVLTAQTRKYRSSSKSVGNKRKNQNRNNNKNLRIEKSFKEKEVFSRRALSESAIAQDVADKWIASGNKLSMSAG